jgi:heme oxygenase
MIATGRLTIVTDEFLPWLFEHTKDCHGAVDHLVRVLLGPELTLERYQDCLVDIYGFDAAVEAALGYTPGAPTLHFHPRSGLIARDLLSLGMRPAEIAALPQAPISPFPDLATAAGWLYVRERFCLYHPILCARISERVPEARSALAYFGGDEVMAGEHWVQFTWALEHVAPDEVKRQHVLAAARAGFETAGKWYDNDRLADRTAV